MTLSENHLAVFGILCLITALGAALEKTRPGAVVGAPGAIILIAVAASQIGFLPRSAPVYDLVWTYLIPLAVALFLLKANLRSIFTEGGRVLLGFLIAALGVLLGTFIGIALLDLGAHEASLAAVFSATYTGGSLNFAAVAEAIEFKDPTSLTAALAIDNMLGTIYIISLNVLAGAALMKRYYPWRHDTLSLGANEAQIESIEHSPGNILNALAIAACVCGLSVWMSAVLGLEAYSLLFITLITVAIATLFPAYLKRIRGEDVLAMVIMYLFFAIIGAGIDIRAMLNAAPALFVFVSLILATHLIVLFVVGRFLKLNHAELITASLACVAGPAAAAAIAILFDWRSLVAPGILAGLFGYIIGNLLGLTVFAALGGFT